MTYRGHFENGVVVLDEKTDIPDGVPVSVELMEPAPIGDPELAARRYELYRPIIGVLDDTPGDWSENHDNYLRELYGA